MRGLILLLTTSVAAWAQGLVTGTYTSGITATGTVNQTCVLSSFNNSNTGGTATVALTGTNTIAGGTALVITAVGAGSTSAPTSATAGNGTATCSGTATVATTITNAHPRIILTPSLITHLQAVVATANPSDPTYQAWLTVKSQADAYVANGMITTTVNVGGGGCTATNPVSCTIVEAAPSPCYVTVAGGTGAWAGLNNPASRYVCTITGTHTITFPVNGTGFGSFSGQNLVMFPSLVFSSTKITYDYEGEGWLSAIEDLGLAWIVTGSSSYSTAALALLDYINSLGAVSMTAPIAIDNGFPTRSYIFSLGLLYDWFYSQLSSAEKTATAVTLNLDYTWYSTPANNAFARTGTGAVYSNYYAGHELGFTSAGWATWEDNSNSPTIVSAIRTNWNTQVPTAFTSPNGFSAGYMVQGSNYGTGTFYNYLTFMNIQNTANNENMIGNTTYAKLISTQENNLLYPNGWRVNMEGDQPGNCSGIWNESLPILLSYLINGTTEGAWAQYFYQNYNFAGMPNPCGNAGIGALPAPEDVFLYYDSTRTATNYKLSQPTYWYSEGDRHSYSRSDWTSSGIFSSFMASAVYWETLGTNGSLPAHEDLPIGSVEIMRGSDWLLSTAGEYKGTTGATGTPYNNEVHTNDAVSGLWFNDGATYLPAAANCAMVQFNFSPYCGGAEIWNGTPSTNYHAETSSYVYQLADLTPAYDLSAGARNATNRTLRSYWRSWLAVGDGTFVVLDRILKKSSSLVANERWYTNTTTPTVSGNQFSSVTGSSKVFGKVFQPTGGTQTLTTSCTTAAAAICYSIVTDPLNSTALSYMTFLYATSSGSSLPTIQSLTGVTTNFAGYEIDDTNPKVVVESYDLQTLGNSYQGSGPVFYATTTYTTVSAFTAQTVHHFITQITAGTYGVYQGGSHITDVTVGADGVAAFTSTGGGTFGLGTPTGTPPTITTTCPMPAGVINVHYSQALQATGDQPYTWTQPTGALPTGLTLTAGVISGTPTVLGTYNFTIQASNGSGNSTNGPISCSPGIVIGSAPVTSGGAGVTGLAGFSGSAGISP